MKLRTISNKQGRMDCHSVLLGLSGDVQQLERQKFAAILFHLTNNLLFMYFWYLHTLIYFFFWLLYSVANSLSPVFANVQFCQGTATRKKAQKGGVRTIPS